MRAHPRGEQLMRAEPQHLPQRRVDRRQVAVTADGEDRVVAALTAQGPVAQLGRQGGVAAAQPALPQQRGQQQVGVGIPLGNAAEHVYSRPPGQVLAAPGRPATRATAATSPVTTRATVHAAAVAAAAAPRSPGSAARPLRRPAARPLPWSRGARPRWRHVRAHRRCGHPAAGRAPSPRPASGACHPAARRQARPAASPCRPAPGSARRAARPGPGRCRKPQLAATPAGGPSLEPGAIQDAPRARRRGAGADQPADRERGLSPVHVRVGNGDLGGQADALGGLRPGHQRTRLDPVHRRDQ